MAPTEGQPESTSNEQAGLVISPQPSFEERHGLTSFKRPAPLDTPESSVEERHGFKRLRKSAPHDTPRSSSGEWDGSTAPAGEIVPQEVPGPSSGEPMGFTGIYGPGLYESPEQGTSNEVNASTQSEDQQEPHEYTNWMFPL